MIAPVTRHWIIRTANGGWFTVAADTHAEALERFGSWAPASRRDAVLAGVISCVMVAP